MNDQKLDPVHLEHILRDCLYHDDEIPADGSAPPNAIVAEGIVQNFGFHPERLESHRSDVKDMLAELPDEFLSSKGGGWTFLNACNDRTGRQWTGEHRSMEALFALGMGLGMVQWCLPRTMWNILPGGMPYVSVDLDGRKSQTT